MHMWCFQASWASIQFTVLFGWISSVGVISHALRLTSDTGKKVHWIPNTRYTTILLHLFNGLFSRTTWQGETTHARTHTHTPFSRTTRVSRNQKGKTNLDFTEARDSKWQWHQLWNRSGFKWGKRWWGYWDGRGISWTICKQSAPCSRQITTPTPRHSIFTGRMFFLTTNQKANTYYSITSGN